MNEHRDELLDRLTAERYDNRWWTTPDLSAATNDNDLTTARRRRLMAADYDELNASEREVR